MSWVASKAKNKFSVGFSGADQRINNLVFDFCSQGYSDLSKRIGQVFNHFGKVRSMNELNGVAMITPFTPGGAIDYAAFPKLIDHYITESITLWFWGRQQRPQPSQTREGRKLPKGSEINAGRRWF